MKKYNWGNVNIMLSNVFTAKDKISAMKSLSHAVRECIRYDVFHGIGKVPENRGFEHPYFKAFRRRVHHFRDMGVLGDARLNYFFGDAKEGAK